MALRTPPSWLQNGVHPAENDRLTMQAIWATSGIVSPTSLDVTENTPNNMSVNVAGGWCVIVGDYQPNMGVYTVFNDATVNLSLAVADPVNPRIDKIVVSVQDSYYVGAADDVILQVITGTPSASPSAPATPVDSLALATIYVGAGVGNITSSNITDLRVSTTTNLPIGDITGVTAGTGLTGGGTSGTVTLSIDSSATIAAAGFTASTGDVLINKTDGIGSVNDYSTLLMMGAL